MEPKKEARISELDFVRGIAISLVIFLHFRVATGTSAAIEALLYPFKFAGGSGVNLFFTLSGFLVGGLLFKEWREHGEINPRRFLIRRALKIWPAYYVLIGFHLVVGRHPPESFFWQNVFHLQNYLGSSIVQTWTLAIEEHFYLGIAFLLAYVAARKVDLTKLLLFLGSVCVVVLLLRTRAVMSGEMDEALRYTQYRIDSLLFGVMLAAIYWLNPELYARLWKRKIIPFGGSILLFAWLLMVSGDSPIARSVGFSLEAIGACCFLMLVRHYSLGIRDSFVFRAIAWLGKYSYGIYLWHSLALAPGERLIKFLLAHQINPDVTTAVALIFQLAIAVFVGYWATKLVERPFLRLRDRYYPPEEASASALNLGGKPVK